MKKILFALFLLIMVSHYSISQTLWVNTPTYGSGSVASFLPGQWVTVSFDYTKPAGSVRLNLIPRYQGQDCTNFIATPSPVLTELAGNLTYYFTLNETGTVDQLEFEFTNEDGSMWYWSYFFPVDFWFTEYTMISCALSLAYPGNLAPNQTVQYNFNYCKPDGDVRIWFIPTYQGQFPDNYFTNSSPVYSSRAGAGVGFFGLTGPGSVDGLLIRFEDANTGQILAEYNTAVNYQWIGYELYNIHLDPAFPGQIPVNQHVEISVYFTKPNGNVRLFCQPLWNGVEPLNYLASGSTLISDNAGTAERWFTLSSPGQVNQLRFYFTDDSPELNILHEITIPVDYNFVSTSGAEETGWCSKLSVYPQPFTDQLTFTIPGTHRILYKLCMLDGKVLYSGWMEGSSATLSTNSLPNGLYLLRLVDGKNSISKLIMKQ